MTRDHRNHLLQLLSRYRPMDALDEAQAEKIRIFIEKNQDCFERTNQKGHITGSAWVMDASETKVLLTHHKKLNLWLQVGGHSDGNPNPLLVALREAKEESGLTELAPLSQEIFDVDVHRIPARDKEPAHDHHDIRFLVKNLREEQPTISEESHDLQWIPLDRLEEWTEEESILRMKKKWFLRLS